MNKKLKLLWNVHELHYKYFSLIITNVNIFIVFVVMENTVGCGDPRCGVWCGRFDYFWIVFVYIVKINFGTFTWHWWHFRHSTWQFSVLPTVYAYAYNKQNASYAQRKGTGLDNSLFPLVAYIIYLKSNLNIYFSLSPRSYSHFLRSRPYHIISVQHSRTRQKRKTGSGADNCNCPVW